MQFKNKTILIISPETWGTNYVSKHHYASQLAKDNRVFFTGPPAWHWHWSYAAPQEKSLTILAYPPLPGINRLPLKFNTYLRKLQAYWLKYVAKTGFDVVWSFDPYVFQELSVFDSCIKIYHCVDLHRTALEYHCIQSADISFFTSDLLLKRYSHCPKPKFQVNHGLSGYFLNSDSKLEWQYSAEKRIQIGVVGNLQSHYLDYEMLHHLILQNPQVDFNLVGPSGKSNLGAASRQNELQTILSLPNVHVLGAFHPSGLPALYQKFDAFLMCYVGESLAVELANPHKLMEYLSSGKVTVCNYTDQYRQHRDLVAMVDKQAELPDLFQHVMHNLEQYNAPELQLKRKEFAQSNSYALQIKRIEEHLTQMGF